MKWFLGILAVLGVLIWWGRDEEVGVDEVAGKEVVVEVEEGRAKLRMLTPNAFTTDYGREGFSTLDDLVVLREILQDCQLYFKNFDEFHLPDNEAVTGFLRGKNPEGLVWIPGDHPAVSEEGELLDRDGRPMVFHRLSGLRFELRAAGEDGVAWTDDDVVLGGEKNQ